MELELEREHGTKGYTAGRMFLNETLECYTLEDQERPVKIKGQTAIPCGRYRVIVNHSNRFQRDMPLLLEVAGFDGIRIHSGNTDDDTDGCILVGTDDGNWKDGWLGNSRAAFNQLFPKIQSAIASGEAVWITIK